MLFSIWHRIFFIENTFPQNGDKIFFLKILFAKWPRENATKLITETSNFSSYNFPNQKKVGSEKSLMSLQVSWCYQNRVNSYANKLTVELILWHSRERKKLQ
jgi:hypothetical protein